MVPTHANRPGNSASLHPRLPSFRVDTPAAESESAPPQEVTVERWEPAQDAAPGAVLGWQLEGKFHFHFPGLAQYVYDPACSECSARSFDGASDGQLIDTYQRAVLPIILQSLGTEVLHGSAIEACGGVFAFVARSGVGKSTLAAEFVARGYRAWADDAVTWRASAGHIVSTPLPFVLRIGGATRSYVPLAASERGAPRKLLGVVVMDRSSEGAPTLNRIARSSTALSSILPHAFCFSTRDPDANRSLISNYLTLVAKVPFHELRFPARRELIPTTIALLEAALDLRSGIESPLTVLHAE
jgi:hypothetical protein